MADPLAGKRDPMRKYLFVVEADGIDRGGFMSISGLHRATDVVEYRDGNDDPTPKKFAGLTKFDPVTLQRGFFDAADDVDLWNISDLVWKYGNKGQGLEPEYKKTVTIKLFDQDHETVIKTWILYNAWVSDYTVDELNATSSDVLLRSVVLQIEGFDEIHGEAGSAA